MSLTQLHKEYVAWKIGNYLPRRVGEQIFALAFIAALKEAKKLRNRRS